MTTCEEYVRERTDGFVGFSGVYALFSYISKILLFMAQQIDKLTEEKLEQKDIDLVLSLTVGVLKEKVDKLHEQNVQLSEEIGRLKTEMHLELIHNTECYEAKTSELFQAMEKRIEIIEKLAGIGSNYKFEDEG